MKRLFPIICALGLLAGCGGDDAPDPTDVQRAAIANYSRIVHASFEDSAARAAELDQ
jgi:hypothetical protein